jgi:sugar-specific transcriptional regulator TrmB
LSEYASRAYLALLQLGATEARAVSRLARVPVAKIYSTLDQLAERGLCIVEPGPPKRFSPVPFESFLERLAAEHEDQARQARAAKEQLAELFRVAEPLGVADDRGSFQVIRGRKATLDRLRQLHAGASSSVVMLASDQMMSRRVVARALFDEARRRGARVRLLARVDAETAEPLAELSDLAEIRAKEPQVSNIMVAIFDERHAMISHFVPDDGNTMRGNDVGLYTDEEAIVGALYAFLEGQWAQAEPLADARARVDQGQPRRFFRTIRSQQEAAMAAQRLMEEGVRDLRALAARVEDLPASTLPAVARARAIARIDTLEDLRAAEALRRSRPTLEIRHAALAPGVEYELFDGRVALVAFRSPQHAGASFSFTNDSRTVWSLLANFEAIWEGAAPLTEREASLAKK